jgi:hypothetical protein
LRSFGASIETGGSAVGPEADGAYAKAGLTSAPINGTSDVAPRPRQIAPRNFRTLRPRDFLELEQFEVRAALQHVCAVLTRASPRRSLIPPSLRMMARTPRDHSRASLQT